MAVGKVWDGSAWAGGAPAAIQLEYLAVGGGGGGGYCSNGWVTGGGGGAGAVLDKVMTVEPDTEFIVSIGAGGGGADPGNEGSGTWMGTNFAGGGAGGGGWQSQAGRSGYGSGGGAGGDASARSGGSTLAPSHTLANRGGNLQHGANDNRNGGGGGGAMAAGQNGAVNKAGDGGAGYKWPITGDYYAGGGGGITRVDAQGAGGIGGGGAGTGGAGVAGTPNTGGGGGSGRSSGGNGGSGVVIIRYPAANSLTIGAGLTSSTTTSGDYKITTFTAGVGTVTIS